MAGSGRGDGEGFGALISGGTLIGSRVDRVLDSSLAFLTANRLPKREPQLSRYEPLDDVGHDLVQALRLLLPMVRNMATRYLFAETRGSNWILLLHNHAKVRADLGLTAYLTDVLQARAIGWSCREHTLRERGGDLSGHPGSAVFYTYAHGKLVRSVSSIYEGKNWRFAQFGAPYEFEHVSRYDAPRKKDRVTCEMVKDYLKALGVFPWEADFCRVTPTHPARGIQFVSDDPTMNEWLDPMSVEESLDRR